MDVVNLSLSLSLSLSSGIRQHHSAGVLSSSREDAELGPDTNGRARHGIHHIVLEIVCSQSPFVISGSLYSSASIEPMT